MKADKPKRRRLLSCARTTHRLQREEGTSLLLALAFVLVVGLLVAVLGSYAHTNFAASRVYREQRKDRYDGDGAVQSAINSVRTQLRMGRDPSYDPSDPACVYKVGTGADAVTVTCEADAGSESGKPAETGLVPDAAIYALGQRHNEVGPLNETQCNTIFGLGRDSASESSLYFRKGEVRDYFEEGSLLPCADRNRPLNQFQVRGNIKASGRLDGNGSLRALPSIVDGATVNPTVTATYGCGINVQPACVTGTAVTDPGGGGTVEAWKHVPIDWTKRSEAYSWNGTQLVANPTCANRSTIIFLPGWYDDANVLNRYTNDADCAESTIWLAPDPGADGKLLTADDKTGAYYFGFTNTSLDSAYDSCIDLDNNNHRWCIGGESASSSPRVVTGTPIDWSPLYEPGGTGSNRTVQIGTGNTVDSNLSVRWANSAGAKTIGDGNVADYQATGCIPFTSICFSTDRAIRVRDFTPNVTAGPADGKISIEVSHRETGTGLSEPTFEVRAVSSSSGQKNCGTNYKVPRNNSGSLATHKLQLDGSEEAAALAIGACMNTADLINGLQITMKVTGNGLNSGGPRLYLDGYRVTLQSAPGASFPAAAPGGAKAKVDCDKTKPGAQLIFGGDSHVYIPDGSLEVCAGPYPTSPGQHQQIGVYGIPAVPPVKPASVTAGSGTTFNDGTNARAIAEVPNRRVLNMSYSTNDSCGFCTIDFEGRASMPFSYTAPAGLRVARVDARVTYDSNNVCFLGLCTGTNSELRIGTCSPDAPLTSDLRSWQTNVTGCFSNADLSNGVTGTWVAKAKRICAFWICGSSSYTDQLDGVELLITLEQDGGATKVPVPQSGCIVAYPNYWEGAGNPDCALIRADSKKPGSIFSDGPDWVGRYSVEGTIYAPSAAMELDDTDAAYPTASRGVVVRHIRVKGFAQRAGYTDPAIDTQIDNRPAPREATFIACRRSGSSTAKCGTVTGDRILTKARVRFTYVSPTNSTPEVVWWTDER